MCGTPRVTSNPRSIVTTAAAPQTKPTPTDTHHQEAAPSPQASQAPPLASLRPGQRARIIAVDAERGTQLAQRLTDLGFIPGRTVEVLRRAPLGDPFLFQVADYEISMRKADVSIVKVEEIER